MHDLVVSNIAHLLMRHEIAEENHAYRMMVKIGFQVSAYDTFVPDVSLVSREQLDREARIIQGAPALAIEVVAPSDLAIHLKRKIDAYLRNGADRVWVVYPASHAVEIYEPAGIRDLRGDDVIDEPNLAGWSVPVSKFFER